MCKTEKKQEQFLCLGFPKNRSSSSLNVFESCFKIVKGQFTKCLICVFF